MTKHSTFRNNLVAAGLLVALAAVPFAQASANDLSPQMQKSSENQTVPDKAADAWITTKVKSEFATKKGIKGSEISVETHDGVVTLSGTVATNMEKTKAKRVASKVKGVKSVNSTELTVGAPSATAPAK
ncbi:MAG: BON domain-containing protein [Rhodanobacter sp.]